MVTKGRDGGFTLVELLVAVTILGVVGVAFASVVVSVLRNTDATSGRLSESHDAQIASAYWAQDVWSIGRRDYTDPLAPVLQQSVETNVAYDAGLFPCGTAGTANAPVRFAWDEAETGSPRRLVVVAYVPKPVTVGGSTLYELHRLRCVDATTPASDTVVAHNLVAAPTVACDGTTTCGPAVPNRVSLTMNIQHPTNRGVSYGVTLNGQRRQT